MKRISLIILSIMLVLSASADYAGDSTRTVYDQGLIHPYSMVSYKNMILVTNYGISNLDEESTSSKGFISAIQGGIVKTFIRNDGHLIAPKGMAIFDNLLFVADVNKIVVYNLKKIVNPPVEINFPKDDVTLSDLSIVGTMLIVSVNNSGRVYGIDLKDLKIISKAKPILLAEVPSANSMLINGTSLYISSFPEDITDKNVIYVGDLTSSEQNPMKFMIEDMSPGQYLDLALSEDCSTLYFSTLKTDEQYHPLIYSYALDGKKKPKVMDIDLTLISPTSILIDNDRLWILDHNASKVYCLDLKAVE